MKKRAISFLLALTMCLSLLPMTATAADKTDTFSQDGVTVTLSGATDKAHKVVDYYQQEFVDGEYQDVYYKWDFEVFTVTEPFVLTISWDEGVEIPLPYSMEYSYLEDCYAVWGLGNFGGPGVEEEFTEEDLEKREKSWELYPEDLIGFYGSGSNSFLGIYAGPVSVFLTQDGVIGSDYAATDTPDTTDTTAYASTQNVSIDGEAVELQAYALKDENGSPTNYVKLRDVAYVLNGSAAQFNVGWDGNVNIVTGDAYEANGSEMSTPFSGDRAYTIPTAATNIDGEAADLAAIVLTDDNGGAYTYYQLRDLGKVLGFNVGWSAERGIFIETDKPYTDAN